MLAALFFGHSYIQRDGYRMARTATRKSKPMAADRPMTAAQVATLKRLAEAAYELDAFKTNLTRVEADTPIATSAARASTCALTKAGWGRR